MVSCILAHPLFLHFGTRVVSLYGDFINKFRPAGREHFFRVRDTTKRIHFARSPGTPQPPNSQLTQDARRPRRSVSQWRRPARAALLQRELASCIRYSFSLLPRAVRAVSFAALSNKKTSWAGACLPACKRFFAL